MIFKNEYDIQNNFWVGSSSSFNISSLYLFILFVKWSKVFFKINSWYTLNIAMYTFLVLFNETRLGQIYLFIFLSAVFFKSISLKKIVNFLLIFTICFYSFSISSFIILKMKNFVGNESYIIRDFRTETIHNYNYLKDFRSDLQDKKSIKSGDTKRIYEILIGIKKFENSNLMEKMIGTGWYSSRLTINPIRNKMLNKYSTYEDIIQSKNSSEVTHLQGIVSLLLDTGIIGLIYTLILLSITIKNAIFSNANLINKYLYILLILINFFCLFIGYPWVSIPFLLMIVPSGLFLLE